MTATATRPVRHAKHSEYDEQAAKFMKKTGAVIALHYVGKKKHFPEDSDARDVYEVTLSRGKKSYTFRFGDSIMNTGHREIQELSKGSLRADTMWNYQNEKARQIVEIAKTSSMVMHGDNYIDLLKRSIASSKGWTEPSDYSILCCLQKNDVGTFEDFCGDFGYDTDSIRAKRTYEAVRDEYLNLAKLFTEAELELMQEIQ